MIFANVLIRNREGKSSEVKSLVRKRKKSDSPFRKFWNRIVRHWKI